MPVAQPVVLFLPARDEAAHRRRRRSAGTRATFDGHPVIVLVVDDGSTDHSAAEARGGRAPRS